MPALVGRRVDDQGPQRRPGGRDFGPARHRRVDHQPRPLRNPARHRRCLPDASWQRCRTHYAKNPSEAVPTSEWKRVRTMFQSTINQEVPARGWAQARAVVDMLEVRLPKAVAHLEEMGF
nr:transposase [Corynebacterium glyciniphilum]